MYTEKGYKIYSEIGMFLIDWLISGTIDILLVNEDTNCAVVGDWKTNRGGLKFRCKSRRNVIIRRIWFLFISS